MADPDGHDSARRALQQIRRDSSQPWRAWPGRVVRALGRGLLGVVRTVGESLAEALLGLVLLGLFIGVVAAGAWGWQHSPVVTVILMVGILGFLAFGVRELFTRRKGERKRGRLAAVAAGVVVFVGAWIVFLLAYLV